MKRTFSVAAACGAIALCLAVTTANAGKSVPAGASESGKLWFVELAGAPVADGISLAKVRTEKTAFRAAASAARIQYKERLTFDTLFNGFSVEVASAADRQKLAKLPGVKAIYPVYTIPMPATGSASGSNPDLEAAITMTGAKIAQDVRGLSGADIKVGIIDTGIDIDHQAFGGSGTSGTTAFPTARVAYGYDLVGDAYNAAGSGAALTPVPDNNPDDCAGHGTHVAGIVGADGGGIRGVAPGVTLGAYRVFGCVGSSSDDVVVAAMERALADGMQVVNQSLGAARQWPQYPTAQAATRLAKMGVVMVASIGNNGPGGSSPDGLFAAGAPGVGTKVIGVASYDNAQRSFVVDGTPYGYTATTGSPLAPTSGSLPMARTGTPTSADDACAALPADSLAGQAVLIRRGTCSFFIKATNAQAAGAAAIVLYNNVAGALAATVAGTPPITVPVVAITAGQGATLDGLIAAGPTTLTWTENYVTFPYGTGGLISGFSSYGPAADLSFKPNIGAPGGGIFSSYPLELGGAATLSGTSMSSPHVAGAAALILEATPTLTPSALLTRLQNSADPANWSGNAALGLLDLAHRQGAGMLDIIGVLDAKTVVEPSQIAVGESQFGAKIFTLAVRNTGNTAVTYDISTISAVQSGPNNVGTGTSYAPTGIFDAPATVVFSTPSLTVPKKGKKTFTVTINANAALPDRSIYGGYIVLKPQGGDATYRVPYAGFKGDYQSTQVLTPTANGFPWLAQLVGTNFNNCPAGCTYTMAGNDIPYFLVHFDHHSRRVRLTVSNVVSGPGGRITQEEYVGRNSTPGGFFSYTWDGTTLNGKYSNPLTPLPNGQYVMKLEVLKALGDPQIVAHWETWTSPVITVARP